MPKKFRELRRAPGCERGLDKGSFFAGCYRAQRCIRCRKPAIVGFKLTLTDTDMISGTLRARNEGQSALWDCRIAGYKNTSLSVTCDVSMLLRGPRRANPRLRLSSIPYFLVSSSEARTEIARRSCDRIPRFLQSPRRNRAEGRRERRFAAETDAERTRSRGLRGGRRGRKEPYECFHL